MDIFLAYPFVLDKEQNHREKIRKIVEKHHFQLRAADDEYKADSIWDEIQREIRNAWYCIFDLTGLNPNVLLELGYAMGQNADVIIIQEQPSKKSWLGRTSDYDDIPSDLSSIRRIMYRDYTELDEKLSKAIQDMKGKESLDNQFRMMTKRLLSNGAKTTKTISECADKELRFSYQMTRNRLEDLWSDDVLEKSYQGKEAVYAWRGG